MAQIYDTMHGLKQNVRSPTKLENTIASNFVSKSANAKDLSDDEKTLYRDALLTRAISQGGNKQFTSPSALTDLLNQADSELSGAIVDRPDGLPGFTAVRNYFKGSKVLDPVKLYSMDQPQTLPNPGSNNPYAVGTSGPDNPNLSPEDPAKYGYTEEDLTHNMKKYSKTREEVLKKMMENPR
jgi:hypothetical protein